MSSTASIHFIMDVALTVAIIIASIIVVCICCLVIFLMYFKKHMLAAVCNCEASLDGKTVIVTGSNSGIGRETAKDMARRGARVIMACRSLEAARKVAEEIRSETGCGEKLVVMHLDLSDLDSVRQFAAKFNSNEGALHILINNAGAVGLPYTKTKQGIELTMATNHFGHFLLTMLLLPALKKSAPSRIVTVSSMGHMFGRINFDDINYERSYNKYFVYGDSKLVNILFMRELTKKLAGSQVTTYSLHPGSFSSGISQGLAATSCLYKCLVTPYFLVFGKTWWQAAQTSIHCAVSSECAEESGLYYSNCKVTRPGCNAQNDEVAAKLWDVSIKMVKYNEDSDTATRPAQ